MKDVNILKSNGVNVDKSLNEIFGDMESYNDTLNTFLIEVGDILAKLKLYKEANDMQNYSIIVHALKSTGKYLGFKDLAEFSFNHEMESKANNSQYVREHFDELMTEANRIVNLVKQYVGMDRAMPNAIPAEQPQEATVIQFPGNTMANETTQRQETTITQFPGNAMPNAIPANTILVADDSDVVRGFISNAIHGEYKILGAHDGQEAINILNSDVNKNIAGLLLDLNMPKVDGFQVLEYMQQENLFSQVPVAIITGDILKSSIDRSFQYPIRDMLQKPFNDTNVRNVIEKLVMFHTEYSNSHSEESLNNQEESFARKAA